MPESVRVALKVQRRCYARTAAREVSVHERIQAAGPCAEIAGLREAFIHDGHICMAYDLHGRSLESALDRGPLPVARVRRVSRQLLMAIARLHDCSFAHTDVKPDNILYDPRTGTARLADLGSARNELRQGSRPGTREYYPPEVLIGAPLSPALDLWCLGCTVFEILTGHTLFLPYKAAARKYREFSSETAPVPLDASVAQDEKVEAEEQLKRGDVIAGKYALDRVLGQGRFATVWAAREISSARIGEPAVKLRAFAQNAEEPDAPESEREQAERVWRRERGADDLVDLTLNYEHLILITALLGPISRGYLDTGRFRAAYFEADGELRFRPKVPARSLRTRIRRHTTLRGAALDLATDFLQRLLQVRPEARCSAAELLGHPWVRQKDKE